MKFNTVTVTSTQKRGLFQFKKINVIIKTSTYTKSLKEKYSKRTYEK